MVCDGPDPPDNSPHELSPPSRQDLLMHGHQAEDSDEEQNEYFLYQPLPQEPDGAHSDSENEEENGINLETETPRDVPPIERMETIIVRDVWNTPRNSDPIEMDNERAQQVMTAMANFTLPQTSIPEWAQTITEDQWRETLNDRIDRLKTTSK